MTKIQKNSSAANETYAVLTDYAFARGRTEIYFGSRDAQTATIMHYTASGPVAKETKWVPALYTAFREIVDNSLDELITHGVFGKSQRIDITYDEANMIFTVADTGRGIPIHWDETQKLYAPTVLLGSLRAGRNFGDIIGDENQQAIDSKTKKRGKNGVGGATVNQTSEFFDVVINRDGMSFEQRFTEGTDNLQIEDPLIFPSDSKTTGTMIKFKPSAKVYKTMLLPLEFVQDRVFEIALSYPFLKVFFNGKRIAVKSVEETVFPNRNPIYINISEEDFSAKYWLVPDFSEDGSEYFSSSVNAIPSFDGGVQIDSFRKHFFSGLLAALEKESKRRKLVPNRSDISSGLLIYNLIEMAKPLFNSQTKSRLMNEEVSNIIKKHLDDANFFKDIVKRYPEWIEAIYEKCSSRTEKKDAADLNKTAKKAKKEKVEDLTDACGRDRSQCILLITEGKSAAAGAIGARNPDIIGALPLRGKPMNVKEKLLAEVMQNVPLVSIMKSVGIFPNQRINRHNLRYGKIYIATDADEDGKNIAALLVNFFFHYWPELFDAEKTPFIYVFDTPLIIAIKGKVRKYWYKEDYHNFDADKYKSWEITRAKGLAALKKEDWKFVLENSKLIPILDDGKLADAMTLLFQKSEADNRKTWIGK